MKRTGKKLLALGLAAAMTVSAFSIYNSAGNAKVEAAETTAVSQERVGEDGCKEIPGTVSSFDEYNASFLSVTGYAQDGVKDRTADLNTSKHRKVSTPAEFLQAVRDAKKNTGTDKEVSQGAVTVIEVMNDIDLGPQVAGFDDIQSAAGYKNTLTQPGNFLVSNISMSDINGLTVFSAGGSSLLHCELDIGSGGDNPMPSNDIVIRNLAFDGCWEWDNTGSQKDAGWAYVVIQMSTNVWIDHCSFTIACDGNIDIKNGSSGVTLSWCKFGMTSEEAKKEGSVVYDSVQFMEKQFISAKVQDRYAKYLENLTKIKDAGYTEDEDSLAKLQKENATLYKAYNNAVTKLKDAKTLNNGTMYADMRLAGATPEDIMAYAAYHSKVHLVGSGDNEFRDMDNEDGTTYPDSNERLRLTLAYDWYQNVGQRVPMIRMGIGHLYNCYIDDTDHVKSMENEAVKKYAKYTLTRCINARDGASIAADTCVFNGINEPLVGKEVQGDDIANMNPPFDSFYATAVNYALIVNSKTTNTVGETSTGSSWDNNGSNQFTRNGGSFNYSSKTLKKWCWDSKIVKLAGVDIADVSRNMIKVASSTWGDGSAPIVIWHKNKEDERTFSALELPYIKKLLDNNGNEIRNGANQVMYQPFEWEYNYETALPYEYQLIELDKVQNIVTSNSGAGSVELKDGNDWVRTTYNKDEDVFEKKEEPSPEPSESVNPSTEPGVSAEPSQQPSESAEPSQQPIESAEPSQQPVSPSTEPGVSAEPSQQPSESAEPSVKPSEVVGSDEPVTPSGVKLGDVNHDTKIDLTDAQIVLKAALKILPLEGDELLAADVNHDGKIDLEDAQLVLKAALKIIQFEDAKVKTSAVQQYFNTITALINKELAKAR